MTRIFFSAGESSGDMHGANVIRALHALDPDAACEGLGGTLMAEAGMTLHCDLAGRAIMGFTEVVRSFGFIRTLFNETIDRLRESQPDCLVLIDYPGFNIRLAKEARALGIPVVYYISPQVWAWKKGRIKTLARCVNKMLVILPFEKDLYDAVGVPCVYVGHPLLDHVEAATTDGTEKNETIIGLLPGSREQEIRRILPVMIEVAEAIRKKYPESRFAVPCVDSAREAQVRAIAGAFPLETTMGQTSALLKRARFCMVASGTATLETALYRVPMAVLYRVTPVTYALARLLVRIEFIAMVNILAGKSVVPEFIQHKAKANLIVPAALRLISDSPERQSMLDGLDSVRKTLGGPGASERAAHEILASARDTDHACGIRTMTDSNG